MNRENEIELVGEVLMLRGFVQALMGVLIGSLPPEGRDEAVRHLKDVAEASAKVGNIRLLAEMREEALPHVRQSAADLLADVLKGLDLNRPETPQS